jgi:hypothetical protein
MVGVSSGPVCHCAEVRMQLLDVSAGCTMKLVCPDQLKIEKI